MTLSPRLRYRVRQHIDLALMCVFVGIVYQVWQDGLVFPFVGIIIGILLGNVLAVFELSPAARWTRGHPFWLTVLLKATAYLVVALITMMVVSFVGGAIQGLTVADYVAWIRSKRMIVDVLVALGAFILAVAIRQIDQFLGPGRLLRYVTGYYHRPRREQRIFMFLDLKSSTTIAERLAPDDYYDLLRTFFSDLNQAVVDTSAEIYQYVGDEVVLTWKLDVGLRDANCIWLHALFAARIHEHREYYRSKFGLVPEFKAGVHAGEVITAEIGDLRRDVVFSGDVLNTAARIEGMCNRFGKRLIASRTLVDQLPHIPPGFESESLGPVELTGKVEPLELIALA